MRIELPKKDFWYTGKDSQTYANVKNGILYIVGIEDISWEKIAMDITYSIYGKQICQYCLRRAERISIDHKYARNCGGVTIPNNLIPACRRCNGTKNELNYDQFKNLRTMKDKKIRESYRRNIIIKNERIRCEKGFELHRKWIIDKIDISEVIVMDNISRNENKKYLKSIKFIKEYRNVPNPLVISKNNILLEGHSLYLAELDSKLEKVPVLRLENVIVVD